MKTDDPVSSESDVDEYSLLMSSPAPDADKLHGRLHERLVARRAHRSSWATQMRAALQRNFSIKRRQKQRTVAELLSPLYVFLLLAVIRSSIPGVHMPAILTPAGSASVTGDVSSVTPLAVFVSPDGTHQRKFADRLRLRLTELSYRCHVQSVPDVSIIEEYARAGQGTPALGVLLPPDPYTNYTYVLRADQRLALGLSDLEGGRDQRHSRVGVPLQLPLMCSGNQLFYSGVLTVQNAIDSVFLSMAAESPVKPSDITILNGPKADSDAVSATVLRLFIPIYMVISLSQFITYQLILVVGEKETKIKDCLKLMGLRDSVYWMSWFIVYALYIVIVSSCCCLILKVTYVFAHSDLMLILVFYMLYGFSLIFLGFAMTPFFNKAKVAGGVGSLMVSAVSMLYLFQVYLKSMPRSFFWVVSLLSPVAFTLGIDRVVELEVAAEGATFATLHQTDGGFSLYNAMCMLVVDIVIYAFLAFYLDNVIPTEFGRRESPFFLFRWSYWFRSTVRVETPCSVLEGDSFHQHVEPVAPQLRGKAAVRVQSLSKHFKTSGQTVTAVNDLSLDMYEGHITAILGHNGAGKTTFFNVITGLTRPTSGTVVIYGLDISDPGDMRELWSMTGICPQHDILIPELTPRDHLRFIAAIRNIADEYIQVEVERTLSDVGLLEKADDSVKSLSGGQKRKLSIGQALIGDPRVVILDEPTAGLDPCSRRHMWDLLSSRKAGRILLLSTHFMDEADVLADRKAVISSGRLRCCGSSMYLKNKFGLGYHLTVVMGESAVPAKVDELVSSRVPAREIGRRHGNELAFILPMDSVNVFPELFSQLEDQQDSLNVLSFGLSLTSLEEVFLQLAERDLASDGTLSDLTRDMMRRRVFLDESDSATPSGGDTTNHNSHVIDFDQPQSHVHRSLVMSSRPPDVQLRPSAWRALGALLRVRCYNFIRVRSNIVFSLLLPVVMLYVGLSLNSGGGGGIGHKAAQNISILLSPDLYDKYDSVLIHRGEGVSEQDVRTLLVGSGLKVERFNGSFTALLEKPSALAAVNISRLARSASPSRFSVVLQDSALLGSTLMVNTLNNGILRLIAGVDDGLSINTILNPLPSSSPELDFDVGVFTSGFFIGFLFLLFPCSTVVDLVMERQTGIRNQLRVNGVNFSAYYLSHWLLHLSIFLCLWLFMLVMVRVMDVVTFSSGPALSMLASTYLLYCFSSLLFASACSLLFSSVQMAQTIYPNVSNSVGMLSYMVVALFDMVQLGSGWGVRLHYIFSVINPFYLPCGTIYILSRKYLLVTGLKGRTLTYSDFWTDPLYLVPIGAQLVQMVLSWYLLVMMDRLRVYGIKWHALEVLKRCCRWVKSCFRRRPKPVDLSPDLDLPQGDSDVASEKSRVSRIASELATCGDRQGAVLVASNLVKTFTSRVADSGRTRAVDGVSFAVEPGEVFGLLGPNGAGKTTTIRVMIAEEGVDGGEIYIGGWPLHSRQSRAFQQIGYCPQFDCLWPLVTVEEHIRCWAAVRGVSSSEMSAVVQYYLDGLWIGSHAAKPSGKCSGGTKRKLSYALSMLGRPRIVLLDEPSTGMDPQSKRFLWDTISAAFAGDRGAVLTTHSMEEADALCTRLAILIRGSMRCIGSTQHLKNKYGGGYVLEIKMITGLDLSERREQMESLVRDMFPSAVIEENYGEMVRYSIPQCEVTSLAQAFTQLQSAKERLGVEEYNLSQTTLEQVFIRFAKQQ